MAESLSHFADMQEENARLLREVSRLKQEKQDLELLIETNIEHSDFIADNLLEKLETTKQRLTEKISTLIRDIDQLTIELNQLRQEKFDLELVLEMNTEHSDLVTDDLLEKVEFTLRESERRFRLITETTPVPIIITTRARNKIVYSNSPAKKLYLTGEKGMQGHSIARFFDTDTLKKLAEQLRLSDSVENYELTAYRYDGQAFWAAIYVQSLEFSNEPCYLVAFHDLTDRKKNEEIKSKFIHLASHELRTPISVISGNLELISMILEELPASVKAGFDYDEIVSMLEKSSEMGHRLTSIITNISRMAQLSAGDYRLEFDNQSLTLLIRSVISEVRVFIEQRQQKLVIGLPEEDIIAPIHGDSIWQVLMNLLLNAIRFTPDGGKITITCCEVENHIEFMVQDTGIGIPATEIEHIFSSFYEVQDTLHHKSGTIEFGSGGLGMGLSIAKSAIDLHQGNMWVESEINKGSSFFFTIPKYQSNRPE